jgi:hypothetical protein
MDIVSGTLDTGRAGSASPTLALTNETVITLYVYHKDGVQSNSRVQLEISPDNTGDEWFQVGQPICAYETTTIVASATRVRCEAIEIDNGTSTVHYTIRAT